MTDPFNLHRFVEAQANGTYDRALREIQDGRKRTHWMWYIFPQIRGLGTSDTARAYGIASAAEAREYLNHDVLGPRLRACAEAALAAREVSATHIFGTPDDLKLRSSATLFASIAEAGSVFDKLLSRFWGGAPDARTAELLRRSEPPASA